MESFRTTNFPKDTSFLASYFLDFWEQFSKKTQVFITTISYTTPFFSKSSRLISIFDPIFEGKSNGAVTELCWKLLNLVKQSWPSLPWASLMTSLAMTSLSFFPILELMYSVNRNKKNENEKSSFVCWSFNQQNCCAFSHHRKLIEPTFKKE